MNKLNYAEVKAYIEKGRNGVSRPAGNNTRYNDRGEFVAVTLHATDVIRLYPNGDTEFDSGGWRTVTTKDRMSWARDFAIFSDRGTWKIYHRGAANALDRRVRRKLGLPLREDEMRSEDQIWGDPSDLPYLGHVGPRGGGYGFFQDLAEEIGLKEARAIYLLYAKLTSKTTYLFFDGIRFTKRGRCVNGYPANEAKAKEARDDKLRKRIYEFAKDAVRNLDEGTLPLQDTGDCFYCQMRTTDHVPEDSRFNFSTGSLRGRPLGDATQNTEHLLSHMEESYFPSALYVNAMDEQPYTDLGKSMHLGVQEGVDGTLRFGGISETTWGVRRNHSAQTVAKAIYEYVARRLLPDREVRGNFGGFGFRLPEPTTREEVTA